MVPGQSGHPRPAGAARPDTPARSSDVIICEVFLAGPGWSRAGGHAVSSELLSRHLHTTKVHEDCRMQLLKQGSRLVCEETPSALPYSALKGCERNPVGRHSSITLLYRSLYQGPDVTSKQRDRHRHHHNYSFALPCFPGFLVEYMIGLGPAYPLGKPGGKILAVSLGHQR